MSTTPPEAQPEYSRGVSGSERILVPHSHPSGHPDSSDSEASSHAAPGAEATASGALPAALFAGGLLGALLLLVAEFTTLFEVHVAVAGTPVKSVATGPHHSYAMALIAIVAAALAFAVWRAASWPALVALGVLGLTALLIALLGDLPDANATGLVLTSSHYVEANATPSAGFYMETLGAVVLLLTSVCGLLLIAPPLELRRRPRRSAL
jgi:hypothetical protein